MATAPLVAAALPDGEWLPCGRRAAICFGIDDVHPASARDAYDAGGDLGSGALAHPTAAFPKLDVESRPIAAKAGLRTVPGFQAPGWEVHEDLAEALADTGFRFVAGARDVRTPIAADAVCDMSGPRGLPLLHPQPIAGGRLTHIASNFQATSSIDRAVAIAAHGGLISIKAHIYKRAYSYVALDGLDLSYRDYLDRIFSLLADRYGDTLWWTSMNEIAEIVQQPVLRTDPLAS